MARSTDWTRSETLAAFHIYLQLPFGQLHRNQPRIVQLSQWIGRTASAVAMKLVNLASLDPQIVASGRRGMGHASKLDEQIWDEFLAANDPLVTEAATAFGHYAEQNGLPPFVDVLDEVPEIAEGKTTTALVQVRVNQARFRLSILASYNATCCMSGFGHRHPFVCARKQTGRRQSGSLHLPRPRGLRITPRQQTHECGLPVAKRGGLMG